MLTCFFYCLVVVIIFMFLWEKRRILYYGSKINGPPAIPLVGSFFLLTLTMENFIKKMRNLLDANRPTCKLWIGPKLCVIVTTPADVETILTTCLSKSSFYDKFNEYVANSLFTLKVNVWKEHRKIINPTFNKKILVSLHSTFVRYAKKMVKFLHVESGREQLNFTITVWEKTTDIAFESLTDVEPSTFEDRYMVIRAAVAGGKIFIQRSFKFWLELFWKFTSVSKEQEILTKNVYALEQNILSGWDNGYEPANKDELRSKRFLPYLMSLSERTNVITRDEIIHECVFMLGAAGETTAATITTVLTILGVLDHIQEKVYEELCSVLSPDEKDPTFDEIKRLDYLERVVKESMRIFPVVPYIMRSVQKDIQLDSHLLPAGCEVVIPIVTIHSDPDVWPEPQKFDPDRFFPEEISKRHRCSYIPFSYGTRNCIGLKYAMMSMKVMLAVILKEFRVKTLEIKSLKDIEWEYYMTTKPTNSRLIFERRIR